MRSRRRTSLRTKISVLTITLILVTAVVISMFLIRQELTYRHEDLVNHGLSMATMAAQNCEYGIYAEDRTALQQIVDAFESDARVTYAVVLNKNRQYLAFNIKNPSVTPPTMPHHEGLTVERPTGFAEFVSPGDGNSYIDIMTAVVSLAKEETADIFLGEHGTMKRTVIGYVNLGLNQEELRRQTGQFIWSALLFTSVSAVLGIVMTIVVTKRIVSPIKDLAQVARDISEGNFDHYVEIRTNDEISELTDAFNHMLVRLKEYRSEVEQRNAELVDANQQMLREILHRKKTEQEIKKLNEELEKRVEQRTEDLKKAYEELQELDRAKDMFLSSVSHELRTPLTSIRSFSEMLLNYPEEDLETKHEFLRIINVESERLTRLVNDVLDLAKINAGKIEWKPKKVDPETVITHAVQSQYALLKEKNHTLDIDLQPGVPEFTADEDRILQVLTNLIHNAIKFTPPGGRISIRCGLLERKRVGDTTDFIHISVSDTGIGISSEDLTRVFDRFRQCGDTLKDKPSGTGLGLAICREIVTYHGGNIWAESVLGQGSTFHCTVPVDSPLDSFRQRDRLETHPV